MKSFPDRKFLDRDFLLTTKTAQRLYHEVAAEEPIWDYHCHLIPQEIADNRRFPDLAAMWLGGDHYKWRAMRSNGIDERFITGDAEPYDKFLAWAETVPYLIGNPLYHWTHLELQRYFDISEPLNRESAPEIWKTTYETLQKDPRFSVYGIFKRFKVYAVGTTDDPGDTLEWHEKIATAQATETKVVPSFRPDKVIAIDKEDFAAYIARLGAAAGKTICSLEDLLEVLKARMDLFDTWGCRASDHGLEYIPFELAKDSSKGIAGEQTWEKEVHETLVKVLAGTPVDARSLESYKTFMLCFLGAQYHDRGWVMQLHLAAIRSINSQAFKTLGPDTGHDGIHDHRIAENLARFLDRLQSRQKLPRTILYSLNPKDMYTLGSIMGSFQGDGIPGKMQLGSAWWFLDHRDGMENQMKVLGNLGLLSRFVGMLTDSRSFLSYPRHEYFRRILCNMLGAWAEAGEIPLHFPLLSGMVQDISFRNAQRYFARHDRI
ncbi:MAG: glucuronate isomerase [Treponema sp.]|jgi:glucuronate isomerase|nr:glucuronate isomerase [Treponema sp.]